MKKISSFLALFLISLGMMAQTPMENVKVTLARDKSASVLAMDGTSITGATAVFSTDATLSDKPEDPFPRDHNFFLPTQTTHNQQEYKSEMLVKLPYQYQVGEIRLHLVGCWGDQWAPGQSYINAKVTLNDGVNNLFTSEAKHVQINGAGGVILPLAMDKAYSFDKDKEFKLIISLTGVLEGQNVLYGYDEITIVPSTPSDAELLAQLQKYLEANPANSKQWGNPLNFVVYDDALAQNPKSVAEFEAYTNAHCKDIYENAIYSLRNIGKASVNENGWKNLVVCVDGDSKVSFGKIVDAFDAPVPMDIMNSLFQIEKYYDGEHYYIKHLNSGLYLTVNPDNTCSWTENGTFVTFAPADKNFQFMKCDNGNICLKEVNGQFEIVCDAAKDDNSAKWLLENYKYANLDFTGAEGAEGWCSAYFPFAIQANEGVNVTSYGVSATGAGVATLKEMDGVQANQGAILKAAAAGTYTFLMGDYAKTTAAGFKNLLSGTNVAKEVAGAYVLGLNNGVAGLYGSNNPVMKANKAYLVTTKSAANGFKLSFDEVTGVENVEVVTPAEEANAVYYDLSGRRVMNPANGVYIKNGKKVYVK